MTRGPYYLLLVLALVLQCSPLCTCNLIELFSCGDEHAVDVRRASETAVGSLSRFVHTCETAEGSEDCSGGCLAQKGLEKGRPASIDRDQLAPFGAAWVLALTPPDLRLERPFDRPEQVCPSGPNPPRNTPLLI